MCIAFNQLLIHVKCDRFHWPPFIMQVVQKKVANKPITFVMNQ